MGVGTDFNSSSGPIRGMHRIEPLFIRPPCGIQPDLEVVRRPPSASQWMQDGATVAQLRDAGFTVAELATAGVTALVLRQGGYPTSAIAMSRRYGAVDLRLAGVPLIQCLGAGVPAQELVRVGYTARDFGEAGVRRPALVALGFQTEEAGAHGHVQAPPRGSMGDSSSNRPATASRRRPQTAPVRRPQTAPPAPAGRAPSGGGGSRAII